MAIGPTALEARPTADEIVADAAEAHNRLSALDVALQTRLDEIRFRAFQEDREFTPAEAAERKGLLASQGEVREAKVELSFVTLQRLDASEDVKRLKTQIARVNSGLKDDLDRLRRLERYAEIAAKVAETLVKVAGKLAAFA